MKRILQAVIAAVFLPMAAQANTLDYTTLSAGYEYSHSNSGSSSETWSGGGSFGFGRNFYVYGSAGHTDRDRFSDEDGWDAGGGFHTPISGRTDFIGEIAYSQHMIDGRSGDIRDYSAQIGLRSAVAPHFEASVYAGDENVHNGIDDRTNNIVFGQFDGHYRFNRNWGLVGEITIAPSSRYAHASQQYYIGPRFSF